MQTSVQDKTAAAQPAKAAAPAPAKSAARTAAQTAGRPAAKKSGTPARKAASAASAPAPRAGAASAARQKKVAKPAKPAKPEKAAKPAKAPKADKLVRDSFTIPRGEYELLQDLKLRAATLGHPAKKSELLRAGIQALKALDDPALQALLRQVPIIKTGRPARD